MRLAVLALSAIFLAYIPSTDQINDNEASALRNALNLPASPSLKVRQSKIIPDGSPLKVFIEGIVDKNFRDRFAAWVSEWNIKEGKKHGALEIVNDLSQADVILVRYLQPWALTREEKIALAAAVTFLGAEKEAAGKELTFSYSYFLTRNNDGFEVIWRQKSMSYQGAFEGAVSTLGKELQKRLKARKKKR